MTMQQQPLPGHKSPTVLPNVQKRKVGQEPSPRGDTTKKQKKEEVQYVSNQDFRPPSSWGQQEPIGITQAEIPLTNADVFRLRGWYWRKNSKDTKADRLDEMGCQSPAGTKFYFPGEMAS